MRPGTRVEVRSTFDGSWIEGFEVVTDDGDDGYQLRRLSDGEVLPVPFPRDGVRRQRSRETWWL
jgi:hypothetical protein